MTGHTATAASRRDDTARRPERPSLAALDLAAAQAETAFALHRIADALETIEMVMRGANDRQR
jgi:hypothetical protein